MGALSTLRFSRYLFMLEPTQNVEAAKTNSSKSAFQETCDFISQSNRAFYQSPARP